MTGASSDSYLGGLFRTKSAANFSRSKKSLQRYYASQNGLAKPRKARAPRPPRATKRDMVAELLSEGLEFDQIAERMGLTSKAVEHHFAAIRKSLGPQAV